MRFIYNSRKVCSFPLVDAHKIQPGMEARISSAWENANMDVLVVFSCRGSSLDIYIYVEVYMFILRPWVKGWRSEG